MPKSANLKIDPSALASVSALDLLHMISKYPVVTRKMLLIVPQIKGDNLEVQMNAAADKLKTEATAKVWTVTELRGTAATTSAILSALTLEDPDFVVYYGHSVSSNIGAYSGSGPDIAISASNANVLSGLTASITACSTLNTVGTAAVNATCVAFMGYSGLYSAVFSANSATKAIILSAPLTQEWIDGTNAVNLALIDGATFTDAKAVGRKAWDDIWIKWTAMRKLNPKIPSFVPANALDNRDRLDFVGTANAVARPIGLLVTT
ncbi:MAG: hypothetical protein WBN04_13585 [Paracoccaceae bacterium]